MTDDGAAAPPPPADAPPAGDGEPSTRPAAPPPSADALLALDSAAASARWASLDDAALDAEVAAYRAALEGLRSELAALGRSVELEDGQAGTIAGIEVREGGVWGRGSAKGRRADAFFSNATPTSSIPLFPHRHPPKPQLKNPPHRASRAWTTTWAPSTTWTRPSGRCVDCVCGVRRVAGGVSTPLFPFHPSSTSHNHRSASSLYFPQQVPPHCIPVHANVTTYDWTRLTTACPGGFDVIMMDPPWQLATANPTRGVALGYSQLTDADITALPIPSLQENGFLFIWVINAKYKFALDLFASWGYE
jgi:hypothetical protein